VIRVKATREGLPGQLTKSGWRITPWVAFVALPSNAALWRWVIVRNPGNMVWTVARVLDVGPWNTDDDQYVFAEARPQAESGTDTRGRATNLAGIDLGEKVWRDLLMTDNGPVEWAFCDLFGAQADGADVLTWEADRLRAVNPGNA